MRKTIKTNITIARGSDDVVRIYIEDDSSRTQFLEIKLDYESFARVITGLHGVECESLVHGLEYVGKKRVTENRSVVCPLDTYDREKFQQWIVDNCQEEGWLISSYLGSQSSVVHREGKTTLNYRVTKYVEE